MGRGDYHWQHEPCWYAVRKKGNWTGDRKQTTLWTIPQRRPGRRNRARDPEAGRVHAPADAEQLEPGQAIYEPFLGSGTTLIAAQSCGRVCFGIEIDPLFVDVAIRRWQAFTGEKAKRASDGVDFRCARARKRQAIEEAS